MSMQMTAVQPIYRAQSYVAAYSPSFATALSGHSTWCREARAVVFLASELGITLDEEALALCDVRDLQALRHTLQRRLAQ